MSAQPPRPSNEATGLGAATTAADFNILGSYGSLAALPTRGVRKDPNHLLSFWKGSQVTSTGSACALLALLRLPRPYEPSGLTRTRRCRLRARGGAQTM